MDANARLRDYIDNYPGKISKVVDINPTDLLLKLNLTAANTGLSPEIIADTGRFSQWVNKKLADNNCRYAIGGYMELRTIYDSRPHFTAAGEPRCLHLGVDIWGDAGTPVYAPLDGVIHSFKDNNNFGDYGPTIILVHELDGLVLYSLYGHLSRNNLGALAVGQPIISGQQIGSIGAAHENGNWPPHLHFQLMFDMEGNAGDYPGACKNSEKEKYLQNIPDPALILRFQKPVNEI